MPTRSSASGRQTRIGFTPLPSSSPAKAAQPSAVRHRVAAVSLEGSPSPSKKQRLHYTPPTPVASSQREQQSKFGTSSSDEDEIVAPSSSRGTSFMRGNRSASDIRQTRTKSGASESSHKSPSSRTPANSRLFDQFDDSESPVEGLTSRPAPPQKMTAARRTSFLADDDESSEEIVSPRMKRPAVRVKESFEISSSNNESESSDATPFRRGRLRARHASSNSSKRGTQEDLDLKEDLDFLEPTGQQATQSNCSRVLIFHTCQMMRSQ